MNNAIRLAGGADLADDGDMALYVSPEARERPWFDPTRRVVYVNGMGNRPQDHARSARALSLLQGCPVVGIYNRTDGFWDDLGQCLADKLTLVTAQAFDFRGWAAAVEAGHGDAQRSRPGLSKVDFVAGLVADNVATLAVYRYVTGMSATERRGLKLYCHSQGNLIVSNALTAVALALGEAAIAGLEVNGFGSPCRFWPAGLRRTNNAFTFDPVGWMDYRFGFDSVKIGFVAGHGFDLYMRHDAEFVVNRFRWGSFGLTASMDEAGLAAYCVGIGNNPPQLKAVFERLIRAHWSDSDDVAEIYVRRMRGEHPQVMHAMARADPGLIRLLIRCLDEGWTTSGEKREMDWLAGLI